MSDRWPDRQTIRRRDHNYQSAARYFVTICAAERACIFGEIVNGTSTLSEAGRIVDEEWRRSTVLRTYVTLDAYVVMPNHLHGILCIDPPPVTVQRMGTVISPPSGSLGAIIGQFKAAVTKRAVQLPDVPGAVWQRGYHEHIIRDDVDLQRIRRYIAENPLHWAEDEENPINVKPGIVKQRR